MLNENPQTFQQLCLENQSLFNNLELIWIQHWGLKELVTNAYFHLHGKLNNVIKIKNCFLTKLFHNFFNICFGLTAPIYFFYFD